MGKKIFIIFSLISSLLLVALFGQVSAAAAPNQRWVCLESARCDKVPECASLPIFSGLQVTHRAWLKAAADNKPLPNKETYIIECLETLQGEICTSGNAQVDDSVFGQGNNRLETLKTLLNYHFSSLYSIEGNVATPANNPMTSDNGGEIGISVWSDGTGKHMPKRKFLALNYFEQSPGPTLPVVGAQQQGGLGLNFNEVDKDCLAIRWDPYGRVFDSQTLEPVPVQTVSLLKKRGDGSFTILDPSEVLGGNIINPQTTEEDGFFSFVVADGTYKLDVVGARTTFPVTDLTSIYSTYNAVYSEIYPAEMGEEIVQAGAIQHRDIPVSVSGAPTDNPPKLMEYSLTARPLRKKVIVEGRTSHPFTKLTFWTFIPEAGNPKGPGNMVYRMTSDRWGEFKAVISTADFDVNNGEYFGKVVMTKTDLRQLAKNNVLLSAVSKLFDWLTGGVKAQSNTESSEFSFEPIPTYLKGYAYGSDKSVIPNAVVEIYVKNSTIPYYQTAADENGLFEISSENIPTVPYDIQFKSTGGAANKESTTDYIVQNGNYIASNQSSPYIYKNANGEVVDNEEQPAPTVVITASARKPIPGNAYLGYIVTLLGLIIAGGIVGFYIYKKRTVV